MWWVSIRADNEFAQPRLITERPDTFTGLVGLYYEGCVEGDAMKLDWLPNWRNESEYLNPDKTSDKQWAWEFLRRNREYQQDYERFQAYERKFPYPDTPEDMGAPLNEYATCDPPAFENETKDEYIKRMAEASQAWKLTPLPAALAEKHGLSLPVLSDPRRDDPGILAFSAASGPSVLDLLDEKHLDFIHPMRPERVSEMVMKFNLDLPIDVQIEKAKFILEMKQRGLAKKGSIQPKNPRNHREKYINYLRLLDAEVCGVEVREMAEVIFPDKRNEYPDFSGDHTVKNQLKAAKRLRDSGYRYLTLK